MIEGWRHEEVMISHISNTIREMVRGMVIGKDTKVEGAS